MAMQHIDIWHLARRPMRLMLALPLAAACTTQLIPPAAPQPREARVIMAPVDSVWNAVIDYFTRAVISIETIDRSSGFIVASRALIPAETKADSAAAALLADCGRYPKGSIEENILVLPTSAKYNVVVRSRGPTASTLLVTAKFIGTHRERPAYDCTSKGLFETTVETVVEAAATRR